MISSTTLPPSITPTLPQGTPAPGTSQTTTPSGLIIVRNELTPVSRGSQLIVVDQPLSGDAAVDAAKAAHAELSARAGTPAADIMLGEQVRLAEQVRADELRLAAIQAFLAGDLTTAVQLIGRT